MNPNLTRPTHNWHEAAACARPGTEDVFFPDGKHNTAQRALEICATCPLATAVACLTDALATEGACVAGREGIRGGTTRHTRQKLYDRITNSDRPAADLIAEAVTTSAARVTALPRTLRDAYERRVVPGEGGHVKWNRRTTSVTFQGKFYSAMALAFTVGHGRAPTGSCAQRAVSAGASLPSTWSTGQCARPPRDRPAAGGHGRPLRRHGRVRVRPVGP
ncbi:WhiB family transcriptional regulator [Streptomyces sp. NBC_01508]|uniref:WhiB family transcriptional regulator n=1 Tax=Streptomyces sp. NBC_01508 TaxID=2903888 RepID=UPI00386C740E